MRRHRRRSPTSCRVPPRPCLHILCPTRSRTARDFCDESRRRFILFLYYHCCRYRCYRTYVHTRKSITINVTRLYFESRARGGTYRATVVHRARLTNRLKNLSFERRLWSVFSLIPPSRDESRSCARCTRSLRQKRIIISNERWEMQPSVRTESII